MEDVIESVRLYPLLYNASLRHHSAPQRRSAWREVAASIGLSEVKCKLRNEEHCVQYWTHREISRRKVCDANRTGQKSHGSSEPTEKMKEDRGLDEDEMFLLSYVPALKRLTPQNRAKVKMKIQKVLFDAEFKEE